MLMDDSFFFFSDVGDVLVILMFDGTCDISRYCRCTY